MSEFDTRVKPLIADVPGWLTDEEGEALYGLARACTGTGVIVEIGSWKGKSTICRHAGLWALSYGHVRYVFIVGANAVHGQTADWYATGTNTAQAAAPFCAISNSFTGDPVKLAQYVNGIDYDYAC